MVLLAFALTSSNQELAQAMVYSPDTDFTVGSDTGLNGFNGAVQNSDDFVCPSPSGDCTAGDDVTASMVQDPGTCPEDYNTATLTITNNSGVALTNLELVLNLSGTGATFSGEPYSLTPAGFVIAEANVLDPAYPAVPNAIHDTAGSQTLAIYTLPAGDSTLAVDYVLGTAATQLTLTVQQIPLFLNASGAVTATGSSSITPGAVPVITTGTRPAATVSDSQIVLSGFNVSTGTPLWRSGTDGSFAPLSNANPTYTINDEDRANGYVDMSLQALSGDGCDASASCRADITGATYDFGDAPTTYDLSDTGLPIAAAAFIHSTPTLYLGSIVPDAEASAAPGANATLDDTTVTDDEEGASFFTSSSGGSRLSVGVTVTGTNNTGNDARACVWLDGGVDGVDPLVDYVDGLFGGSERVCADVVYNGGDCTTTGDASAYTFSCVIEFPHRFTTAGSTFARVRLAPTSVLSLQSYGASANGEVEDYELDLDPTSVVMGDVALEAHRVDDFIYRLISADAARAMLAGFNADLAEQLANDPAALADALNDYLDPDGDGQVAVLTWETLSERGTIGFFVDRKAVGDTAWNRLNNGNMLPGLITAPMGGEYRLVDPDAQGHTDYLYLLIEQEARGKQRQYGPYEIRMQ